MQTDLRRIRQHWTDPVSFYRDRDARTRLQVNDLYRYVNQPVEIHIDGNHGSEMTIQRMGLLAANLTCRWARNVHVVAPKVNLVPPLNSFGDERLDQRIMREMSEADPFGNFTVSESSSGNPEALRLFIGQCCNSSRAEDDYTVTAKGWVAEGRRGASVSLDIIDAAAASAAALAAAIGAGDLFKRAIGHQRNEWIGSFQWCTWEHRLVTADQCCAAPPIPPLADLGNLLVGGIGAIGSALLYIIGLMSVRGRIMVLDCDTVEASNLNRSPLFTARDVVESLKKTDAAANFLSALGIETEPVLGKWREQSERLSRMEFDVWVSLTNEDGAWAEVPFQLPPVVLQGTTTSSWGIGFGRHIPRVEDCTACRLPRPHAEFRGPCSEGEISDYGKEPVRASLPFLSTISAALIATEILKLAFPSSSSLPNAVYADFRLGLPTVVSALIGPTPGCKGCQVAHLPLWSERGGRSRYAKLSLSRS